ncbi:MAG: GAF domain-containing sensor histidine kinase [Armatimonadota bacterium]|nr:GAF domain-containing sensor histidine kinase [Armatimonadota bacterium]MDR7427682.1 GAF domain-containing sensor histidine kinase [Armatimonadota bacterium]MDR7464002.1 GAF domain-containing sensor histidine kinase [Armatimonadota bacterium]MDR7470291.1 GAF domain-containing sensor histidine kinase [Armatimonadota bacterium]MDR7475390.1 GAF domain-containing sensor histidine kinase [Armatimonadota bacterium]
MLSFALLGLLSVGIGIELAVTAFLLLRFVESREAQVGWWAAAFALYTAHVLLEALAFIWPGVIILRHLFFVLAAAAIARSLGPLPLPLSPLLAVVAIVLSALLLPSFPGWAAVPPSLLGGAWFVLAAVRYLRGVGGLEERSSLLVFGGLLLTGAISLAYPLLRPQPIWVGVGAGLSGLFTIAFALGVLLRSWARARDLATVNAVAETLNRSTNIQEALQTSLQRIVELMNLRSGWVFIQEDGGYTLAAHRALPEPLAANDAAAMAGDCRCLQLLREGRLRQAVNTVPCLRLENAGWPQVRHASVPLYTAGRAVGVMNLLLPEGRNLVGRELDMLAAVGHQIALAVERNRLFEEVRAKEAARGELIEKLLTAQEDERRRIARELHDEAGQALTALILNLEMAERAAPPEEATRLERLRAIAEHTLGELRTLIYELRPTILDDLGLGAAIRWLVKEVVEPTGIKVDLQLQGLERRLPHAVETAVFRIAQEAFNNMLKHAQASRVRVAVGVDHREVSITVEDNGRGFNPATVPPSRTGRGLGLLGMRERAELLGGRLVVESTVGQGTRVHGVLPLRDGGG